MDKLEALERILKLGVYNRENDMENLKMLVTETQSFNPYSNGSSFFIRERNAK